MHRKKPMKLFMVFNCFALLFIFFLVSINWISSIFPSHHTWYYKLLSIHDSMIFPFSHTSLYFFINHSDSEPKTLFPFIVFSISFTRLLLPFSIFFIFIIYNTSFSVSYIRNQTISVPFPLLGKKILFYK